MRMNVALAAGLCLMMTAAAAHAQSHPENRGYGGPMYVGPNFEQGGQHAPPVYGKGSSYGKKAVIERAPVKRPPPDVARSAKAPPAREAEVPAPKETATDPGGTTTIVAAPATEDGTGAGAGTAAADTGSAAKTCKKFEPTVGRTIDAPCE